MRQILHPLGAICTPKCKPGALVLVHQTKHHTLGSFLIYLPSKVRPLGFSLPSTTSWLCTTHGITRPSRHTSWCTLTHGRIFWARKAFPLSGPSSFGLHAMRYVSLRKDRLLLPGGILVVIARLKKRVIGLRATRISHRDVSDFWLIHHSSWDTMTRGVRNGDELADRTSRWENRELRVITKCFS